MTKIVFTEALDEWTEARPISITVHEQYWEFAEFHLNYLRNEKPELMNTLLLCGEMGAYLNLLGKLNATLKDFYLEEYNPFEEFLCHSDLILYIIYFLHNIVF